MFKTMSEYYAKTTRTMLASVKEVGAMPFILFEYYLTWATASGGIKPSLQRVADDLGLEKNAVCNLRSKLIKAGWIRYENEEVFITKSFRKNESETENHSEKMNEPFRKNERSYRKNEQTFRKNESHIRNRINKDYQEVEEARNAPATAQDAEKIEDAPRQEQTTPYSPNSSTPKKDVFAPRRLSVDEAAEQFERKVELSPEDTQALDIYREFFGAVFLRGHQIKFITDAIKDFRLWRRVCDLWFTNGHGATNLDGLVDRYNNELARKPKYDEKGFINHSTKPVSKFYH